MIENEQMTLFRTVETRRGRKFIYMKHVMFKLWDDPQQERRVKEAVNKVLFDLKSKYAVDEKFDDDDESVEDKYAAVADAIEMNENMRKYGIIDRPKEIQVIYDRAVAQYMQNETGDTDTSITESTIRFFQQMARCVIDDAEALIAKGEVITDEKIAELCHEVWLNFNED